MKKKFPGSEFVIGYKNDSRSDKDETDVEETASENDEDIFLDDGDGPRKKKPTSNEKKKEIEFIFFQTASMRKVLNQYPEVIGMDTTYKTNKNNMHLVVMKCIDNHGNGRTVGYSFLARETKDTLKATLTNFRDLNPEPCSKTKTVLVDKDYKEISNLHAILPNVAVHLCHVHVLRLLKAKLSEHHVVKKKEATNVLKKMSESASKDEFLMHYEKLKALCNESFMAYFDKNWKDIDEAWVLYVRNSSLTAGIRSTNHIESHNGKIKKMTRRANSLGDCIRSILIPECNCDFESSYKDFRELATRAYVTSSDDPVVQNIMDSFAQWPAKLLYYEWMSSFDDFSESLCTEDEDCSCNFFKKFGIMHCRHIFRLRRDSGKTNC